MKNILRFLKGHWIWVFVIVLLLIAQTFCDLGLPTYTGDILNVGLQQKGIADGVMDTVRAESLQSLEMFLSEEQIALVESAYGPADESGIRTLNKEIDHDALNEALMNAEVAVLAMQNPQTAAEGSESMQAQIPTDGAGSSDNADLSQMADTYKKQLAVVYVGQEYAAQGKDLDKIQTAYLWKDGLIMLGLSLLMMALSILVSLIASRVSSSIGRDLREQAYRKVTSFSNAEMTKFSTASLITRCTNDITQVQVLIVMFLRMILYSPILAIGGIIMVYRTTSGMGWIIVLAVALLFGILGILGVIVMPKFKIMQSLVDKVNLISREILNGVMPIRAFSRERHEEERFDEANTNLLKTQLFTNRAMAIMSPFMMFIMNGVSVLIVWVGGHHINEGTMQVGEMTAFLTYSMVIVMSFLMLAMIAIIAPRAVVSANRIAEVLDQDLSIADRPDAKDSLLDDPQGRVVFDHVSFHYPDADENIVSDISFTSEPGTTTAIIGSTGCGKSTLLNLIPRFYDVTEGSITIDGVDIRDVTQHKLHSLMGYVPQKGFLFSGTIESNLKYSDEEISDEAMELAAQIAQATEFIEQKENKYEDEISQGGTNVSGGQKQRLSIARALARKPKIMLFDDSFSALDYKTDTALRRQLHQELGDATVFIVAQRISTILHADQILVLNEGRMMGLGTHEELLDRCPTYQEIARSQLSEEELKRKGGADRG